MYTRDVEFKPEKMKCVVTEQQVYEQHQSTIQHTHRKFITLQYLMCTGGAYL